MFDFDVSNGYVVLRILCGAFMLPNAYMKLRNPQGSVGFFQKAGYPMPMAFVVLATACTASPSAAPSNMKRGSSAIGPTELRTSLERTPRTAAAPAFRSRMRFGVVFFMGMLLSGQSTGVVADRR